MGFIYQVQAVPADFLCSWSRAHSPFRQLPGQALQPRRCLPELFVRTQGHSPGHHAGASPATATGCNISRPTPAQSLKCCSVKQEHLLSNNFQPSAGRPAPSAAASSNLTQTTFSEMRSLQKQMMNSAQQLAGRARSLGFRGQLTPYKTPGDTQNHLQYLKHLHVSQVPWETRHSWRPADSRAPPTACGC